MRKGGVLTGEIGCGDNKSRRVRLKRQPSKGAVILLRKCLLSCPFSAAAAALTMSVSPNLTAKRRVSGIVQIPAAIGALRRNRRGAGARPMPPQAALGGSAASPRCSCVSLCETHGAPARGFLRSVIKSKPSPLLFGKMGGSVSYVISQP